MYTPRMYTPALHHGGTTPQVYQWTGENTYIVRGGPSSLVIGSSQGAFGLWLDESFNQGRSQVGGVAAATFLHQPVINTPSDHHQYQQC